MSIRKFCKEWNMGSQIIKDMNNAHKKKCKNCERLQKEIDRLVSEKNRAVGSD
jgi:hypothetical protein